MGKQYVWKMRVVCALALFLCASLPLRAAPGLRGNVFSQPWPVADFTLTDQHGAAFHLADAARGKAVVFSFIYTHCTDYCPFIALKLREAVKLLGPDAGKVVVVAVTTDPQRDTPAVNARYSKALGMFDSWHLVTGPMPAMRRVWKDYFVGVEKETGSATTEKSADSKARQAALEEAQKVASGLSGMDKALVGRIIDQFGGGYDVSHDVPFWFADTRGMMRAFLDADATPADIAFNLRALLSE